MTAREARRAYLEQRFKEAQRRNDVEAMRRWLAALNELEEAK